MYYPVNVRNIWILEQVLETYYSVTGLSLGGDLGKVAALNSQTSRVC